MGRMQNYQSIKFDEWTQEWNTHCANIESGVEDWEAVYRRTSNQLQSYHNNTFLEGANCKITMTPIRSAHGVLRGHLQEGGEGAAFDGLVGVSFPPSVPRSAGSAGGGAAGVEGLSEDVETGGGGDDMGGGGDDIGGGGDGVEAQPTGKKSKGPARAPQMCTTYGHRRQQGSYQSAHPPPRQSGGKPPCDVPVQERRAETARTGRSRAGKKSWSVCDCDKCKQLVEDRVVGVCRVA